MGNIVRAGANLEQIGDSYYEAIKRQWLDHLEKERRRWFVLEAPLLIDCLRGVDAAKLNGFFSQYEARRTELGMNPTPGYIIIENNEKIYPKVMDLVADQAREKNGEQRRIISVSKS